MVLNQRGFKRLIILIIRVYLHFFSHLKTFLKHKLSVCGTNCGSMNIFYTKILNYGRKHGVWDRNSSFLIWICFMSFSSYANLTNPIHFRTSPLAPCAKEHMRIVFTHNKSHGNEKRTHGENNWFYIVFVRYT